MLFGAPWPLRRFWTTDIAASMGIAKPCAETPRKRKPRPLEEAAVSIPITFPEASTSGPPESPGWTLASTWMRFWRVSGLAPVSSVAVMVWPIATTEPVAVDGVPPLPRALPMATIGSPTFSFDGSPMLTVFRFEAPWSWRRAMSSAGSVPTTLTW